MSTLDSSIVNVALPTLQHTFGVSVTTIGWVSLAYLLTLTILLLPFGRLGDAVGRRRMFLVGLGLFIAGSAACGFATSAATLIASRVLQALGASLVSANTTAIITATFPASMRGRALGMIGAVVGLGLTVGPPVGGFLLEAWGWRWIFFVNLPVGVLAIVLGLRLVPRDVRVAGAPRETGPLRLFDRALFFDPAFGTAALALFLSFVALFASVFLTPFYLERVLGLAPAAVGRVLVVVPLLLVSISPLAGTLSDRMGTRRLAIAGLSILTAGMLLMAFLVGGPAPAGVLALVCGLFVVGLGQGLFQSPNASAAMGAAPLEKLGLAGGAIATLRNLGMLCGVGLAATIFEGREAAYLAAGLAAAPAAGAGMRDALVVAAGIAVLGVFTVSRGPRGRTSS
jgi:MFS family permease